MNQQEVEQYLETINAEKRHENVSVSAAVMLPKVLPGAHAIVIFRLKEHVISSFSWMRLQMGTARSGSPYIAGAVALQASIGHCDKRAGSLLV